MKKIKKNNHITLIIFTLLMIILGGAWRLVNNKSKLNTNNKPFELSQPQSVKPTVTTVASDLVGASDKQQASSGSFQGYLLAPTGNFVSNHSPSLTGRLSSNNDQSICNSTQTAVCKIAFTKDGVTKLLADKVLDGNGTNYWNWTLQDIGLTAGPWKVTATASLNGQTKTSVDATLLIVQP